MRLITLALAVGTFAQVSAAEPLSKVVDRVAVEEMAKQHIAGLAIGVVERGKPVYLKGYGSANLELGVKVTPDTSFKIGSVSKQFLCSAVLKLAEAGKLSIEDPITKYFPDSPAYWSTITLRRLMTHTSGLPRELPGWNTNTPYTEDDWVRLAKECKPLFACGENYSYSNVGYFLLAVVISKVATKPWPDAMKELVFGPNGLNSTRTTSHFELIPNRSQGYEWRNGVWTNEPMMVSIRPSGAFVSSLRDLARWETVLDSKDFFRPETYTAMWSPTLLNDGKTHPYGFGWSFPELNGAKLIEHSGATMAFRSDFVRLVDRRIAVIVLANTDVANCSTIAKRVLTHFMPQK